MQLEILTPDKKVFSGEVNSVQVPGSKGSFEVLNNHAPIISTLDKGLVKVRSKNGEEKFMISSGVIEVLKNKVVVLAESLINE
jgi:F-type H+-transporting ATPase subunit epsilon